jgi:hypothetical protein
MARPDGLLAAEAATSNPARRRVVEPSCCPSGVRSARPISWPGLPKNFFCGGERGTRTLDLGIVSAILPVFRVASFRNLLFSLDPTVQHLPLFSLVAAQNRHTRFARAYAANAFNTAWGLSLMPTRADERGTRRFSPTLLPQLP